MRLIIKLNKLALWVNITLNCHVVGFAIGCHEAIIIVMNIFLTTFSQWYKLNLSLKCH